MKVACVIPVGSGRKQNLTRVVKSLAAGEVKPEIVVMVLDGPEVGIGKELASVCKGLPHVFITQLKEKHQPGMPQPRNVGVHYAEEKAKGLGLDLSHVWFVDSDCIVGKNALAEFKRANRAASTTDAPMKLVNERILIGRYDWLAQGAEGPSDPIEMVDPRHEALEQRDAAQTFRSDLSAGLACFSGNLVWPVEAFKRVGGFWNEIHHGRCEDGELGLRAVQMGIPIAFVGRARAWHLWHPRNLAAIELMNVRDVPMLNERHPWVESRCNCGHQKLMHMTPMGGVDGKEQMGERGSGGCKDCGCDKYEQALFVVEEDGKRYNARCKCGWEGNTAEIWWHESKCPIKVTIT
jgi:GT2 family glycosyltransferase